MNRKEVFDPKSVVERWFRLIKTHLLVSLRTGFVSQCIYMCEMSVHGHVFVECTKHVLVKPIEGLQL